MSEEPVEHAIELIDRLDVQLEDKAVLPGDAVTFDDLRHAPREIGDFGELAGCRPDPDDREDRVAERGRIDLQAVAADDSRLLHPLEAFAHRGGGHADAPGKHGEREPRIGAQEPEQGAVLPVEQEGGRAKVLHAIYL